MTKVPAALSYVILHEGAPRSYYSGKEPDAPLFGATIHTTPRFSTEQAAVTIIKTFGSAGDRCVVRPVNAGKNKRKQRG